MDARNSKLLRSTGDERTAGDNAVQCFQHNHVAARHTLTHTHKSWPPQIDFLFLELRILFSLIQDSSTVGEGHDGMYTLIQSMVVWSASKTNMDDGSLSADVQ